MSFNAFTLFVFCALLFSDVDANRIRLKDPGYEPDFESESANTHEWNGIARPDGMSDSDWYSWTGWKSGTNPHGMTGEEDPVLDTAKVQQNIEGLMENIKERIRRRLDVVAPALEEINDVQRGLKAIAGFVGDSSPVTAHNSCHSNPCPDGKLCYESATSSEGFSCNDPEYPEYPEYPEVTEEPVDPARIPCDEYTALNCMWGSKCYVAPESRRRRGFFCNCEDAEDRKFFGDKCQYEYENVGVRLVNSEGPNDNFGRIQILWDSWGSICADDIDEEAKKLIAETACAKLGKNAKFDDTLESLDYLATTDDVVFEWMNCSGLEPGETIYRCENVPGKDCGGKTVTARCGEYSSHDAVTVD